MTQRSRTAWHFALAVVFVAMGLAACQGCRPAPPAPQAPGSASADAGPPTLRLYLVSDLAGALEPCGCTKDQLGGLGHFGAWVERDRAQAGASFVAAAGPLFFMDSRIDPEKADQDRAKAAAMARILGRLNLVAFAPGANDWAEGPEGLTELAKQAGATAIVDAGSSPGSATVVVRPVGDGPLKVAFVGYGQPPADARSPDPEKSAVDAVRDGVERAKAQGASLFVALASVGRGEAKRIADAVPDLTAIVVGSAKADGDANTTAPEGERVGDVLVVQSANHLQSVAVLDVYVRDAASVTPGRPVKLADGAGLELASRRQDLRSRIDELHVKIAAWERDEGVSAADLAARRSDLARLEGELRALEARPAPPSGSFFRYAVREIRESLGKDPAIEAELTGYYKTVDEHNRVAFADRLPVPAAPGEATYVGVEVCTSCHAAARRVWNGTAHAHAYATLSSQFKELNLDCVSCHVTGYDKPGGSTVTHVDALRDVQCEVCHGPGSKHAASPTNDTSLVASPPPSRCLDCHHSPHVEQFDAVAKMSDILGPGHGRPGG